MTGDVDDMLARLKSVMPYRWWANVAPLRDALLGGVADSLVWVYGLYLYVKAQTRIATATEFNLDIIAWDFFGGRFGRRPSQEDESFRRAVIQEILRPRATRPGMVIALENLTGKAPIIFEPANPKDTGVWSGGAGSGGGAMGWSMRGRYGSLQHPHECWIDAQRPLGQGIPGVEGYGAAAGAWDNNIIDNSSGRSEWTSLKMVTGPVTDLDIYGVVENTRPAGVRCWVRISDRLPPPDLDNQYSYLTSPDDERLILDDYSGIIIDGPPEG